MKLSEAEHNRKLNKVTKFDYKDIIISGCYTGDVIANKWKYMADKPDSFENYDHICLKRTCCDNNSK